MAEIGVLKKQRGMIKTQIVKFQTYLNNFNEQSRVSELKTRLEKAESCWDSFQNIQGQIEVLEAESTSQEEIRDSFESLYYSVIASAREIIDGNQMNQNHINRMDEVNQIANNSQQIRVKLPEIKLPEFDGSYNKWAHFIDTFKALIHENQMLTAVQKFHYLVSCLKGDAAGVLSNLQISEANYAIAYDLLKKRFENKRINVHNHIRAIFELPQATKESAHAIRKLHDDLSQHLRSLKNLGLPVKEWDALIIYIVASKLDPSSKREWEKIVIELAELPTLVRFNSFLNERGQLLERLYDTNSTTNFTHPTGSKLKTERSAKTLSHVSSNSIKCSFCKGTHSIYNCHDFLRLPIDERFKRVKILKLCTNCLRGTHFRKDCKAGNCKKCGQQHNSLLHSTPTDGASSKSDRGNKTHEADCSIIETADQASNSVVSAHTHQETTNTYVLLATAEIQVFDIYGEAHECRILLDSGSQSNFMSKDLYHKLRLPRIALETSIHGLNQTEASSSMKANARIKSIHNSYQAELSFIVIKQITQPLPAIRLNVADLKLPSGLKLADRRFDQPGKIDLLLGAGVFWNLLCVGQIHLGEGNPYLHKTKLGWVVSGPMTIPLNNNKTVCHLSINEVTHKQIENFWRVEELSPRQSRSREETECEQLFSSSTIQDCSGRFVVKLPFREGFSQLGDSLETATKRFYNLEKKLSKSTKLKKRYIDFMDEYQTLGHMSRIEHPVDAVDQAFYYLPHHGVIKESSSTTKLRVVFDASSKTSTGLSLNDVLKVGPTIQEDLFNILLRFRMHRIIIIADVQKMYRQVLIEPSQRRYQRILWRADSGAELEHFELNTVTYGTASASYLATRVLHQMAFNFRGKYPDSSETIIKDFYVDDLITGAQNLEEALRKAREILEILDSGHFPLHKWTFNNPVLYKELQLDSGDVEVGFGDSEDTRALGVQWNSHQDVLHYRNNFPISCQHQSKVTKRSILSMIARIFDPLGLISPTVVLGKILMQRLWQLGVHWDESIPTDLYTLWIQFFNQIKNIECINIPRQITWLNIKDLEIHIFCDASEKAYGACAYVRVTDEHGNVSTRILCAKSRVCPLKTITIPRLELCGALLGARLGQVIFQALESLQPPLFYWTDSTIVLSWLAVEPNQLKTFISNRVAEIQSITSVTNWSHVGTSDNPADIISRGSSPQQLRESQLWWEGPQWLQLRREEWPRHAPMPLPEPIERKVKTVTLVSTNGWSQELFTRFSSLSRLQRVLAYCLRFIRRVQKQDMKLDAITLNANELDDALIVLSKMVQSCEFAADIRNLKTHGSVASNSILASLNPFLDENELVRVGGRLKLSSTPYPQRHPIVLPATHTFTKLVVTHEHLRHLHSGAQATLAAVRLRFWPLRGRSVVRLVLRGCMACFKSNPQEGSYMMGSLPRNRFETSRPFTIVGVDFAGPFLIKDGKIRNRQLVKCYLCIFVCFATKAAHLELASDLSTNTFLDTLKRFVARRGLCRDIYSDNGSNFLGARNELNEIGNILRHLDENDEFRGFLSQTQISWHFTPPHAPNFGGLWEACVKSAKYHLKRILAGARLTFESLYTIIVQVEAVLNSRPLIPLTNDPNDLEPLTPSHFLIGAPMLALPQINVMELPTNRLDHYQRLQQLTQHFWDRWRREYLSYLQQRTKWTTKSPFRVRKGDLVLLKEDNLPPLQWRLARVIELYSGKDGITRVVDVKTTNGIFKRAVSRICKLPIEVENGPELELDAST